MKTQIAGQQAIRYPLGQEFANRIEMTIRKFQESNRPFSVLVLQVENMEQFKKRRPTEIVNGLFHQLYSVIRSAVHPNQFVGVFHNGLGLVFDGMEVGQIDSVATKLAGLAQHVIRQGKYNDLSSRWSDILFQFLSPQSPGILCSRAGWAIYPRDGSSAVQLVNRAMNHITELRNR